MADRQAKTCKVHGTKFAYSDNYDAYYCADCNDWVEDECSDPFCGYCAHRPDRPLLKADD